MFHPSIEPLHDSILSCFHNTISRFPPPHVPGTLPPSAPPYRLGEYLIDLGYLLPHELTGVLARSWHHYEHPPLPLGYLLAARGLIPIPVLATVLVIQGLDRLEHIPPFTPRFLGEQLLIDGYLRPEQLVLLLEEQILEYQHGHWSRLGNLIVKHGWLDQALLGQEVEQQAHGNGSGA